MSVSKRISLVSSIGAMSAALVALVTLIELNKQRRSSYKPLISVVTKHFNLQKFELADSEINLALHWSSGDQENPRDEPLSRPSVQLVTVLAPQRK